MYNKLVTEKIEIDPMVATPPFLAVQGVPVEGTGLFKIAYRYGQVKRLYVMHVIKVYDAVMFGCFRFM